MLSKHCLKKLKILHAYKISLIFVVEDNYHVNNYMFKIDIKSTRRMCKICSKLTIKTPEPSLYC